MAGTRDVLAGVVQLGTLLQQLLLERSTTPRQSDLVVAVFSQAGTVATARLHLAALDLAGLAVPVMFHRQSVYVEASIVFLKLKRLTSSHFCSSFGSRGQQLEHEAFCVDV